MGLIKSEKHFDRCMFCTDDKHPSDLLEKGHIDYICREAVRMGADPIMTVQVACLHAARYFLLNNRGAIAPGYLADFAIVEDLKDFKVVTVYKKGKRVYHEGVLEQFPDRYLVAASGMAGMDTPNTIQTRNIMKRFYLCGDEVSDVENTIGLVAPRVMLCAAHQAHTVLRILAGQFET